jgi:hypothetical protein
MVEEKNAFENDQNSLPEIIFSIRNYFEIFFVPGVMTPPMSPVNTAGSPIGSVIGSVGSSLRRKISDGEINDVSTHAGNGTTRSSWSTIPKDSSQAELSRFEKMSILRNHSQ